MLCQVAEEVSKVAGVKKVLLADAPAFKGLLPGINCSIEYLTLITICPSDKDAVYDVRMTRMALLHT